MKILLYTVSDFKCNALDCINLMLSSFIKTDFDFKIITNSFIHKNDENVIYDESNYNYVGFLKYSKNIPNNYDRYVYLDSDILYFGEICDLFSDKNFSCVIENLPLNNEWFLYEYHDLNYLEKIKKLNGFNAGTFSFVDPSFLTKIRNCFEPHISHNVHKDARLEQSSYNYILTKEINFDINEIHNLTNITQLFADIGSFNIDKKLYHFCGFSNEMQSKYLKMKFFYDKHKR